MRTTLLMPLLALAAVLPWALAAVTAEEPTMKQIQAGDRPGAFALNDQEGRAVRLADGQGHGWFVLAFYPKASTPGCTKEVCSLRDALAELKAQGVAVFGISLDDVASQKRFHEAQQLTYPLLSDPDGSVAAKFGVLPPDAKWTQRVTFVVDPAGVVRHVDRGVAVATHGADLLAVVTKLVAAK